MWKQEGHILPRDIMRTATRTLREARTQGIRNLYELALSRGMF